MSPTLYPCLLLYFALAIFQLRAADVPLTGHVVDENDAPVRGAQIIVSSPGSPLTHLQSQSNPDGAFRVTLPGPGDYLVSVEREGYYELKDRPIHIEASQELTLAINSVREVFQSENVNAETSPVDLDQTQNQERLSGTEINDVPFANSHSLRNAMQLLPGVVQDPAGTLHVNGSSENQVLYLLNGFDISNPISGQFQTVLAVEGIRSLDLSSGRYSPQFGKGSAGVLNIATENGTDQFHYTATDFIPGLSFQQGVRLGSWYPRFGVSGPIIRGKAWFSDTFDSEYSESLVTGLPNGQDTRSGWAGSNLLHAQVNVTPSNIVFADFLVNIDNQGRVGLGPLNPVPTTSNLHTHEYFASVKDQTYFGHGTLVEFGYAHNDYFDGQSPQGSNLYIYSPEGNGGNYFVNSGQTAARDQGMIHGYLPQFKFLGSHQLEAGGSADLLHYNADFHRTGYEVLGLSGQLLSETLYPAPAIFQLGDTEASSWLLDTWRMSKRLQITLGIRQDWNRRIPKVAWSPRVGFSWSPFASGHTKISGGYAVTHDPVTLGMLGQPLDQIAYTTQYTSSGAPAGPAVPTNFTIGNSGLVLPRSTNWTIGVDHQLFAHFFLEAKYLRRREPDGFAFINALAPNAPPSLLPLPSADAPGMYRLTNLRHDDYDGVTVTARQTFSGQFEWMASFTHSRAFSNAVLDPNSAVPLQVLSNLAPMPWNAPNRLLAFAYLPLPQNRRFPRLTKNLAIAVLADMRSGFPFSVRDPAGVVVGAFDSYRYPLNFDLNIALERMVTLRGYRFALRGGVDNLTNQSNPTAVNNVVGAPQYLSFLGDEGRHYVVRIRFFGRAGK